MQSVCLDIKHQIGDEQKGVVILMYKLEKLAILIVIRKSFYQQNESTIETPKPRSNQSKRGKNTRIKYFVIEVTLI